MGNKEEIENLMNEELKRLSLNFELDLIRLSKTLSLISQSKDIVEKYIEYFRSSLTDFQNKASVFTVTLLEFEKEVSEFPLKPVEVDKELYEKFRSYIKGLRALFNVYLTYAKETNDDLDKKSKECISNLELTYNLYTLELQSMQIELDSRLKELQSNFFKTMIEMSTSEYKRATPCEKSEKNLLEGIPDVAEYPIIDSLKNSIKKHKKIAFGLISVIFVLLLGLWVFNNRMEFTRIERSLKPETFPFKRTSKGMEVGGEVNETKKESGGENDQEKIKETSETKSTKNEVEKNKMQQLSSQKKLLFVIALVANIREGPGINYPIFSVAKEGDVLERLDEEHGKWIKVKTRDGELGWISKELVREMEQVNL